MSSKPLAVVLHAAGTNCEAELLRAFRLAGASAELLHLDAVIADPAALDRADLIGFPGGFSFGDDIGAGRVFAAKARERLWTALRAAASRGTPIIGVCNGFQVLIQAGLLPGFAPGEWPDEPPQPTAALAANSSARFRDDWPRVEYPRESVCIWTRNLSQDAPSDDTTRLPIANGEGRFVTMNDEVLRQLERTSQVALRYRDDINGSAGRIAGICDPSGRILGLMPHPERYLDWTRHPFWTRLDPKTRETVPPGLRLFQSAVSEVKGAISQS